MNREVHVQFWEGVELRCPALLAYLKAYQTVAEARHSISPPTSISITVSDCTRPWVTAPRARSSRKPCGLPSFGGEKPLAPIVS